MNAIDLAECILPENERVVKGIKAVGRKAVNILVLGQRDPRGPDNNIRIWVDKNDKFHIRVEKTDRCYKFEKVIECDGFVEIIAK